MSPKLPFFSFLDPFLRSALTIILVVIFFSANAQIAQQDPHRLYEQLRGNNHDTLRLRLLSDLAWQIHNSDSSQKYYKEAIQLSLELNQFDYLAQNYNRIGVTYRNYDLQERALEYYENALTLSQNIGNKKEEGFALNNIAQILYYQGQYKEALDFYESAEAIFQEIGFDEGLGYTYVGKSNVYEEMGNYIQAIQAIDKSLEIRGHQVDRNYLTSILTRGDFYLNIKDYDQAIADYQTYYTHVKGNYHRGEMTAYKRFALWHFHKGQLKEALENANVAIELHQEQPSLETILPVFQMASKAYAQQGDFKNAYQYQMEFARGKEQLMDENTQNSLTNLKLRKQEAEIKSLELDKKIQEEKDARKRMINLGLIVSLIFAIFPLHIYYQSYQKEKKNLAKLDVQKKEIQKQAEELENLNKVKDKLFSILAHDLRGPLNSLKGLIQLLEEGNLTEQEFMEILPLVSQNVGNNSILLENLLMWSRSQMKGMKPIMDKVEISSIYRENEGYLQQLARQKNIRLSNLIPEDVTVLADRGMIDIVLRNLLTNALKFTPEDGEIQLAVEDLGDQWKVLIADTGVGIAEEHIGKIFGSSFHTTVGTKQEKGSGLGLLLSRELIEKNNGTIWLDSSQGSGTTFYFCLPKA
jgi:two-component system, sensor histidine kinase and response regulator